MEEAQRKLQSEIIQHMNKFKFPNRLTELVDRMLETNLEDRHTSNEVNEHSWIRMQALKKLTGVILLILIFFGS